VPLWSDGRREPFSGGVEYVLESARAGMRHGSPGRKLQLLSGIPGEQAVRSAPTDTTDPGENFMPEMKAPTSGDSASDRRRSHRVNIAMPVLIRGKKGTQPFEEPANTISVSAHGCMLRVAAPVARGQEVAIVNTKTAEELPSTVTFIGQKDSGKTEIGVEFAEPSPLFWRIAFPPEDWDPSERKRSGSPRQPEKPLPKPPR
jgi:hypothetical protein